MVCGGWLYPPAIVVQLGDGLGGGVVVTVTVGAGDRLGLGLGHW
jgi:hypothetical protein